MYEKLDCGCILKIGTFRHMSLERTCAIHYKLGLRTKGFGKQKVIARFTRMPKK